MMSMFDGISSLMSDIKSPPFESESTLPADTDVFKTSSGRLKKVTKSYDQTKRRQDVWKKMSDLRRLENALFTSS